MESQPSALAAPEDGAQDAEVKGPTSVEATPRRSFRALLWTLWSVGIFDVNVLLSLTQMLLFLFFWEKVFN